MLISYMYYMIFYFTKYNTILRLIETNKDKNGNTNECIEN